MASETRATLIAGSGSGSGYGSDAAAGASAIGIVRRAGWGADESLRFEADGSDRWPREYHPVQAITVHHTALSVADDPAESVRAVYRLHAVDNGWGDIGYHLLIDPAGTVYEGRFTGGAAPGFEAPPRPGSARCVTAGHVGGHNSGNLGVCLLGDFTGSGPAAAAGERLVEVLRTLCALTGVDPRALLDYTNPATGAAARVRGVAMHRDWPGATSCPGDTFAADFAHVRDLV